MTRSLLPYPAGHLGFPFACVRGQIRSDEYKFILVLDHIYQVNFSEIGLLEVHECQIKLDQIIIDWSNISGCQKIYTFGHLQSRILDK